MVEENAQSESKMQPDIKADLNNKLSPLKNLVSIVEVQLLQKMEEGPLKKIVEENISACHKSLKYIKDM